MRTYVGKVYIFSKYFLKTILKALNKLSTDHDFSEKQFYMFIPTTNIRKSKTYVLMERSIDHCTIHKEGMEYEYKIAFARD